jgi:threonine dehydratase
VIDWPLERDLARSAAAAREAQARIAPFAQRTPLVEAPPVADGDGAAVTRLLKLETLQRTGSFKIRGAAAAITAVGRAREIVAASTGNHGLAVAAVARALALRCRIFVPAGAAASKLARLHDAGVEPIGVAGDPLAAELEARAAAQRSPGAVFVPPYNDADVVLGQATIGLELADELAAAPDALFVPVGGGGLVGGIAVALRARWPRCRIVGCLPAASPAMADAVAAGRVVESRVTSTLADATAGNIEPGALTVPICAALVDELVTLEEDELAAAMRVAVRDLHLVIEGAAALALAASLRDGRGARHVVVLSGAGVGERELHAILAPAAAAGRRRERAGDADGP